MTYPRTAKAKHRASERTKRRAGPRSSVQAETNVQHH